MQKYLGKISDVRFGDGGYQDAMFGLSLSFSFDRNSGISTFSGFWSPAQINPDEYSEWTEKDRETQMLKCFRLIIDTMYKAKVTDIYQLKGKPVEIEIENQTLKSWRILEEVL